jgi:uncharacterized protein
MDTFLWICSVALIVAGVAGTVLPVLPGNVLVLAGMVLGAWIDDFARVGGLTLAVLTALAVLSWALDYVAGLMGARRAGASRQALIGAAIGTVAGLFLGLVGVLFMPLVGAAAGEYSPARRAAGNARGHRHLAGHPAGHGGQGGHRLRDGGHLRGGARAVRDTAPRHAGTPRAAKCSTHSRAGSAPTRAEASPS